MSFTKSDLVKELSNNYPNFLKRDLSKIIDILVYEIKNSLKRGERVELRDVFTLEPRKQSAGLRRNPKSGEKIFIREKKSVLLKISKYWSTKANEKK